MLVNESAFLDSPVPLPLIATLPAAGLTPAGLYPAFRSASPSFLLESGPRRGAGAETQGRYSFLGGSPYLIVTARGDRVECREPSRESPAAPGATAIAIGDPLDVLRGIWRRSSLPAVPGLPPFLGGAVGCLGYGLSRRHRRAGSRLRPSDFPDVHWLFVDLVVAFDHFERRIVLSFCPPGERFLAEPRTRLLAEGRERLRALADALRACAADAPGDPPPDPPRRPLTIQPGMSRADYGAMVERARAYIAAGDIFQANLAQRFAAPLGDRDAFALYRRLRAINPAPFAAYLDLGDTQVVSSSPERLVRLSGREADTRPIAGTRPRGATAAEDADLTADLLLNAKERAEHLMLVDLERNDLGRVCAYGSVKVDELMVTERYSHVIHIVSNIRGVLRDGATGFDLLDAVFPGGTVTGVPKIRCLEIIEELEPAPRGLYTGSIGYLSWSGDMDWNIAIRTLVSRGGEVSLHAGAGIVADSDPDKEYSETLYKAQALFEALGGTPG